MDFTKVYRRIYSESFNIDRFGNNSVSSLLKHIPIFQLDWTRPERQRSCTSSSWVRLWRPSRLSVSTWRPSSIRTSASPSGTWVARTKSDHSGDTTSKTRRVSSSSSTRMIARESEKRKKNCRKCWFNCQLLRELNAYTAILLFYYRQRLNDMLRTW